MTYGIFSVPLQIDRQNNKMYKTYQLNFESQNKATEYTVFLKLTFKETFVTRIEIRNTVIKNIKDRHEENYKMYNKICKSKLYIKT